MHILSINKHILNILHIISPIFIIPIPGPIPCQIAFAYAHAMPRAGPGRPTHAPPLVLGPL